MHPVKTIVEKLAARAGYEIIPRWQMDDFQTVRYICKLFKRLNINLVIDVGANAGQYRDLLRNRVGYSGRIISFEPVPELAHGLMARAATDPNWTVYNMALGALAGSATFNVMDNTEFSSFHIPNNNDVDLAKVGNHIARKVKVKVSTLDQMVSDSNFHDSHNNVYLKLDTQGFDLEVLKGATNFLRSISLIQAEANVIPIYDGSPSYRDLIDFLIEQNFILSGIYLNNDGHFPILVEFDCFMIRRDLAIEDGKLRADD